MRRSASGFGGWFVPVAVVTLLGLGAAQEQAGAGASAEVVSAADTGVVLGSASFVELDGGGVVMTLEVAANDVISGGRHAIHLHENGSCAAGDSDGDGEEEPAGAAGGHFNPTGVPHGVDGPHVGDSQQFNYEFAEDGSFSGEVVFELASLTGESSILSEAGTAVVIHEGTDDTKTDPDGAAGARVACGVVVGAG